MFFAAAFWTYCPGVQAAVCKVRLLCHHGVVDAVEVREKLAVFLSKNTTELSELRDFVLKSLMPIHNEKAVDVLVFVEGRGRTALFDCAYKAVRGASVNLSLTQLANIVNRALDLVLWLLSSKDITFGEFLYRLGVEEFLPSVDEAKLMYVIIFVVCHVSV